MARHRAADRAEHHVHLAVWCLEMVMAIKPGRYPDPDRPIAKWQLAHEHLLAARELLKEEE